RGARLAVHENPPALDADLVGGDLHPGVVQALSGAQVEGLLEDGRGDLGNAALVADNPPRQYVGLAEGVQIAERVDAVAGADDRHLPARDQRADAGPGDDVVESADVLPLRRVELEGHRGHSASWGTRWSCFSSQVAGRCCARWGTRTRVGSGSEEFTKVRKRVSLTGSSSVA